MKRWANTENKIPSLILTILLVILWEIVATIRQVPEYILPLPSSIIKAFLENFPLLFYHGKGTIYAAVIGLLIAIGFALTLAFLMNKSMLLKKTMFPLLVVSQTIPIIALAPIIMIWFGLGILPKVLIVALVCFFPLVVNITEGLDNVDQELLELLLIMGAKPWDIFKHVQIPSMLPYFFSGLKIAATYSVTGAVIGEWLGGNLGLGVYMIRTMHTFSTSSLFAAILTIVALSLLIFKSIEFLGWLMMPWHRSNNKIGSDS